jgi:hypothetical protein
MPTDTDTTADTKTDTKTDTGKTDTTTANAGAELGEAGTKALNAERTRAEKAERLAAQQAEQIEELRRKSQTAEERSLADAEKRGREAATLEGNRRIVRSEIRAAAGGRLNDPEDAAALLGGDLDRFIVKGEVDPKAITSAIDELVKAKPYLATAGTKPAALRGGAATAATGSDFNAEIRRRIHRQ